MDRQQEITLELEARRAEFERLRGGATLLVEQAVEQLRASLQSLDRRCVSFGAQTERIAALERELAALEQSEAAAKAEEEAARLAAEERAAQARAEAACDEALVEKLGERRRAKQA